MPGYYRRAKNWDIVVTDRGILVAAIECKSQVGSFGNNFNNRTGEAIGNAVDLWRAYEADLVGAKNLGLDSFSSSSVRLARRSRSATTGNRSIVRIPPSITPHIRPVTSCCSSALFASASTTQPA